MRIIIAQEARRLETCQCFLAIVWRTSRGEAWYVRRGEVFPDERTETFIRCAALRRDKRVEEPQCLEQEQDNVGRRLISSGAAGRSVPVVWSGEDDKCGPVPAVDTILPQSLAARARGMPRIAFLLPLPTSDAGRAVFGRPGSDRLHPRCGCACARGGQGR
jgi:hypothetical protein